jgi:poly-beta-1,6-N-acetyl-D-glucosamine synthase
MDGGYILITAAHDEAAFIDRTCRSVVAQTLRPRRWIVVDDASSDETAAIVARQARAHPELIELRRIERPPGRDFRNKVRAFGLGLARAREIGFSHIGNLDADISLDPDYYAQILSRFERDPGLGIAGGMVCSSIDGAFVAQHVAADSVAGAVQLFRRECFEQVGGYLPLPHGGIDAAAEIIARKSGWRVRTFADIRVLEHRRTGSATANPLASRMREGRRLHSLGYGLGFFAVRCVRRCMERPRIVGSCTALYGYLMSALRREPVVLPPDTVAYLRAEQRAKMRRLLRLDRAS